MPGERQAHRHSGLLLHCRCSHCCLMSGVVGHAACYNNATWAGLRQSVAALLAAGMWGMPQAGADICGFLGNSTEELCARCEG